MADVAFMVDDEDFNIGYDLLDPLERFERRREQLLDEETKKLMEYVFKFYSFYRAEGDESDMSNFLTIGFCEMILYMSDPEKYDWIYDRLHKLADRYLNNGQMRFMLEQYEIAIMAHIYGNTIDDNIKEFARHIILAAEEHNDYRENRPPPQPERSGIEPSDYADPRNPHRYHGWQPVYILEKEIYVRFNCLIPTEPAPNEISTDALKVKDSNDRLYYIERSELKHYLAYGESNDFGQWVKVKLIEQRTWLYWHETGHYCPNTSNTDDYIMVRRVFYDETDNCRIIFVDRKPRSDGWMFKDYPPPAVQYIAEEEEEEEIVVVPAPPRRSYTHQRSSVIDMVMPNDLFNHIITDAVNKGETCSITFEPLTAENATVLSCFHIFDNDAIHKWVETNESCPLCRARAFCMYVPRIRNAS